MLLLFVVGLWRLGYTSVSETSSDGRFTGYFRDNQLTTRQQMFLIDHSTGRRITISDGYGGSQSIFDGVLPIAVVWHPNSKQIAFLSEADETGALMAYTYHLPMNQPAETWNAEDWESSWDDEWVEKEYRRRARSGSQIEREEAQAMIKKWYGY